jgi:hypothetical protein
MKWRSIKDDPPTDSFSCLLYFPTKGQFGVKQGFYERHYHLWFWYGCSGVREARANQPTHWMPLPEPPDA